MLFASTLALTAATGAAVARENYALIVTASDYPNLDQKYWLKGPKNDAVLVRDYLLGNAPVKFAPEHVTTLGSGDGMRPATHQAILDNLSRLAKEAKAGDFVFLQFSGHGSQQPARADHSEPDGKDEVFLSADAQTAPPDNPTFMPNVLTDDEIADALTAIRKTGAFVWAVFDACHSGTMTRGVLDDGGTVMREIPPSEMGIADSAFAAASGGEANRSAPLPASALADSDGAATGGLVAFFAAQTTEQAPEQPYTVQQADGTTADVTYGVFTHAIFSALAKNPNLTYRQLAQGVLASYVADNWLKPTPLFEGKLDAQVFGNDEVVPAAQWPIVVGGDGVTLSISAGQLQGLAPGSRLLIVPNPAAANEDALGLMEATSVTQLRARLEPVADEAHPAIAATAIPTGAYVRLVEVRYPFELTVARPETAGVDPVAAKLVDDALAGIETTAAKPLKLRVVPAGEPADLRLALLSEAAVARLGSPTAGSGADAAPRLWLLPASGEVSLEAARRPPALLLPAAGATGASGAGFQQKLQDSLTTIFRATGLSRLTAASTFGPRDFTLSFGRQEAGGNAIVPMAAEETPVIRPGDRLYVDFTNASGKAADLNLLFIDHDYGITLLCSAHLAAGDRLFQPFADIEDSDRGSERIVAVINETGKEITDLRFLTQPKLAATRGVEQPGLLGMLDDLGAGVATRASPPSQRDYKTPRGAVLMMSLEALAGTGAARAADVPLNDSRTPEGECEL